jgi:3-ketosteroid 9alpha-monooxygenase subunit B
LNSLIERSYIPAMARDHGFHPVRITRVIQETPDTRSYVLDAPFPYRAGQFLTFRVCGTLRSYSMSSCPDTDSSLMTTVKRVPGGLVSNWVHEHWDAGSVVEATLPAGVFCLRDTSAPLVAFAGGSGITPILSLVKNALATTRRRVRILSAHRDADSVIFGSVLSSLAERYPGRLSVRHHLDADGGFVTPDEVVEFAGADRDADFYLCGPAPFMDLVAEALAGSGVEPSQIMVERFGDAGVSEVSGEVAGVSEEASGAGETASAAGTGTITIVIGRERRSVPRRAGETLLESARRAGLDPPFSCEAGNCATCIGHLTEGEVKMRINNALDDDEVDEGWVLTCQSEPVTSNVTVVYED